MVAPILTGIRARRRSCLNRMTCRVVERNFLRCSENGRGSATMRRMKQKARSSLGRLLALPDAPARQMRLDRIQSLAGAERKVVTGKVKVDERDNLATNADEFGGASAHPRRGPADRRQHRQAAGAIASRVRELIRCSRGVVACSATSMDIRADVQGSFVGKSPVVSA